MSQGIRKGLEARPDHNTRWKTHRAQDKAADTTGAGQEADYPIAWSTDRVFPSGKQLTHPEFCKTLLDLSLLNLFGLTWDHSPFFLRIPQPLPTLQANRLQSWPVLTLESSQMPGLSETHSDTQHPVFLSPSVTSMTHLGDIIVHSLLTWFAVILATPRKPPAISMSPADDCPAHQQSASGLLYLIICVLITLEN